MKSLTINRYIISYLLLAVLVVLQQSLVAQNIRVKASMDTNMLLIGDQTRLHLEVLAPEAYTIVWPEIHDTIIRQVEVIKKSTIDTIRQTDASGSVILKQELVITSFDSGYFAIPPFLFLFKAPGTVDYQAVETEAILLEVFNPAIDMRDDIRDIKDPLRAPVTFAELWPWLLAGLILAACVFLVVYFLRRKKKAQPMVAFRRKPTQPAHLVALDLLEKLRSKKLWQAGKVKEYHTELTDIIRTYITAKFGIHAIEMVTHEILDSVGQTPITATTRQKLKELLELADLVKFARESPLPDEQERSMNQAIDFVKESINLVEAHLAREDESTDSLVNTE